jgi:hypothetical protein
MAESRHRCGEKVTACRPSLLRDPVITKKETIENVRRTE